MFPGVCKYRGVLCFLLVLFLFSGTFSRVAAEEVIPLRLIALIDRDDQGESFTFPTMVFYDYWASETYLLSSTGRITIYDQKFFPVASFGKGRGLYNPRALAVDRHGSIFICQSGDQVTTKKSWLSIYNQAFFLTKEIYFSDIPELTDFNAEKVAVAESGEIYLAGTNKDGELAGVAVLSPEGKFLRILATPEKDVWRPKAKPVSPKDEKSAAATAADSGAETEGAPAIPAGLKPKSSARGRDDDADRGQMEAAAISDVKIDRQGRIYLLSREASYIYVFNAQEKYLHKFGEKGGVFGKLSNPISLAIDLERRVIYVCDYMRHTILCYDYDSGKFVFEFGGRGLGPLWFNFPNSVDVDQRGRVIVSDLFNRRVQVIDPSINERRPLSPVLGGVAAGVRPAPEEARTLPPEIAAPTASDQPGSVAAAPVPSLVAASSLPAPPPPAALASLPALPGSGLLPLTVAVPTPPQAMAGVTVSPLRLSSLLVQSPPARPVAAPTRELAPVRMKKVVAPKGVALPPVSHAPLPSPAPLPPPAVVRASVGGGAASPPARRAVGDSAGGILARFRAMPAAVGVYGPVAALLGVGSWLLYTNR